MKSPNDLLTCLFWFVLHHLLHGVKAGGTFIGYENEVRRFCGVFFFPENLFREQNDGCYFYLGANLFSNA